MATEEAKFTVPVFVTDYLEGKGYSMPWTAMKSYIEEWGAWMSSCGSFYDYHEQDTDGRLYEVHRRSARPAKKVCKEWASLLMNEYTQVQCEDKTCNKWLSDFYESTNFWSLGQDLVMRSFGLGTGGWALWVDNETPKILVRRHGVNSVLPLSWDDDGVTECAFCSAATVRGKRVTQLQVHYIGDDGLYNIATVLFDENGERISGEGEIADLETGCPTPTFALVRPAIANTIVDGSPYGVSVFSDAIDAIEAVDLAYDAIFSEIDLGKMRVMISDVLLEVGDGKDGPVAIPFGKRDCTLFKKVSGNDEFMKEFAPSLRTEQQVSAYRTALQSLGDLTGFGISYFNIDDKGGIRTATEVSSDNSQLMRNIRMHENLLGDAIAQISRAVLHCARKYLDEDLPPEGCIKVNFDDSIIQDTAAEKAQDMAEVAAGLMKKWEWRVKWYGESDEEAKSAVAEEVTDMGY